MRVSQLVIYPVKSCRGVSVPSARATVAGFEGDRRFMVVDAGGRFLSQRKHPVLATVDARYRGEVLTLHAGQDTLRVARRPVGSLVSCEIWGESVDAVDCGGLAAAWLTELLGLDARLVYLPDGGERSTDERFGAGAVGFADGFPYLLTTEASLESLNRELAEPVEMARFRPNLVVAGAAPFEELGWSELRVGEARMRACKPCERCVMVTGDPRTGERQSREPLRTLAAAHDALFGMNAVCDVGGLIRVGDAVVR